MEAILNRLDCNYDGVLDINDIKRGLYLHTLDISEPQLQGAVNLNDFCAYTEMNQDALSYRESNYIQSTDREYFSIPFSISSPNLK
jgi:hypothetical protein